MQDLGTGPNARPRRGAPLRSNFVTSSCSVNCVTIVIERRYTVKHWHENWARLLTFERKSASSDESVACYQVILSGNSTEFSSARCIWQKWTIYPNTMARGPMWLHRLNRLKAGPAHQRWSYSGFFLSYPVFEKWYPYAIRILFWLKSYYPYPKTIRKCINNNILLRTHGPHHRHKITKSG